MFNIIDRLFVAGIALLGGGLVLLRKHKPGELTSDEVPLDVCVETPVVDVEPDHAQTDGAIVYEFRLDLRPQYDVPYAGTSEGTDVSDLGEWKAARMQRVWARQFNG